MRIKQITLYCLAITIISCDKGNHVRTYYLSKTNTTATSTTIQKETGSSGLIWKKPNSWIPSAGSPMRLASFAIPYSGGSGDLSIIQLSGTGGGIEANVNRWRNQLNLKSQSGMEINNNVATKKGQLGRYNILQIINNKIDSAFLCAIIPTQNHTIFVKLSLKPIGVTELEDDFIKFCSSLNIPN